MQVADHPIMHMLTISKEEVVGTSVAMYITYLVIVVEIEQV